MVCDKRFYVKSSFKTKNDWTMTNTCSNDLLELLACIRDQAQRVPRVSCSHVVKKIPNYGFIRFFASA